MMVLHRWHEWINRQPWSACAALLAVMHTGFTALYVADRAVSPLPFASSAVRDVVSSPGIPLVHLAAAVLLVVGLTHPVWRDIAAPLSMGVWCGYTVAIGLAAQFRIPQLALIGPWATIGLAVLAGLVVIGWETGDDDEAS